MINMDNLESVTECTDEGNVGGYPSRLSQSSDSSTCTVKSNNYGRRGKVCCQQTACLSSNEIQQAPKGRSKKSMNLFTKLKHASCQTGNFEEMYDEQIMFQQTTLEGCQQIRNIIDKNMSPTFVGLYKICFELEQTISEPKHLPSENIQNYLIKGFLMLAYSWVNFSSYFGMSQYKFKNSDTTCADITQSFRNWTGVSQKLMEDLITIFEHEINADSLQTIMYREEINKTKADTNQMTGLKNQGFTSHNRHPCNVTQGGYSTFCPFTAPLKDRCSINTTDRNDSPVVYASTPQDMISVHHSASVYDVGSNTKNSVYVQNNSVIMCRNDDPNCRNIGFPDMKTENMGSQNQAGVPKGKGSVQYPKDNGTRRTKVSSVNAASFHSTYQNTQYSERTCVLYSDERSHTSTIKELTLHLNQNTSGPPTIITSQKLECWHSQPHTKNQLTAGRGKTLKSKQNNNFTRNSFVPFPTMRGNNHTLMSQQCNEQDISDNLQGRVCKKPGRHDVPKKQHAFINSSNTVSVITKSNVNNPARPQSAPGMAVPSPTAHTLPPSSCSAETRPRNVRHIHVTKPQESKLQSAPSVAQNNDSSDISVLIWKTACGPDETPLETLEGIKQYSKSPSEGNVEREGQKMIDKECRVKNRSGSTEEIIKSNCEAYGKGKESHCRTSTATAERRHKCNILKTDDWLVSTLKNVSELRNDAKEKFTGEEEGTIPSIYTKSPTSKKPEGTSNTENYDSSETTTKPYQQRSAASKNVPVKQKPGGKKEEGQFILRSRKPMSGISGKKVHSQYQDLGRSNSESRNRKLQECSPTEEHQAMQTKNQGSMKVYVGTCKPKNDIHNKATQNILYSTRHGRGLASVTVNKLDHILNVVWNMEASDFVKFPASFSEVSRPSYNKMCLRHLSLARLKGYLRIALKSAREAS
jgi:hypothetical protein